MNLPFELPEFLAPYVEDDRIRAAAIFVFFLLAAVIATVFLRFLSRLTSLTRTQADELFLNTVSKPVYVTIIAFGTYLALETLLAPGPDMTMPVLPAALKTLVIVIWLVTLTRVWTQVLRNFSAGRHAGPLQMRTVPLFLNVGRILLFGFASYLLFLAWNINISAWLASAGVVGIAIGFAAKDSLANLFAGMFIITDSPYGVGDYIVLDTGERGKVTDIGLRTTRILTRDDLEVTIPNSVIGNAKIINESGGPYRYQRLRVPVGVAYGSNVDQVQEVLLRVAAESETVLKNPEPRVRFRSFGNSGLDFELMGWIALPEDRGRILHELNMSVYKAFARENIEIPFPKRDLYVRDWPSLTTKS